MDSKKYIGMDVHKESISIAVMNGVVEKTKSTGSHGPATEHMARSEQISIDQVG